MKKLMLLLTVLLFSCACVFAQTITTSPITITTKCGGDTVKVSYTITGTFTAGNIFTAQLSDAAGAFTAPVNIGTLTTVVAGSITATIPSATTSGTGYKIRVVSNTPAITGTTSTSTLIINARPALPAVTPAARCSTGVVTLSATPGGANEVIKWYSAATAGTLLTTANSYTTTSIATSTNYYALDSNTVTKCVASSRVAVLATVNTLPAAPTAGVTQNTVCPGGSTLVDATFVTGANIYMYIWTTPTPGTGTVTCGTTNTGFSCGTGPINTTTTFYLGTKNIVTGCESATRFPVVASVYSTQTAPVTTGAGRCGTGTATITATVPSGYFVDWYSAATGGTLLLSNSLSYTTPSIATSTTYYAQARPNAACSTLVSATRTAATVTINPIPAVPTLPVGGSRCGAGTVSISATPASGANTLEWFSASTAGNSLGVSNPFTTPSISATTIYYAQSKNTTTGCSSTTRLAVTATVNGIPDVSAGVQVKNSALTGLINYPLCSGTGTEKLSITVPAVTPASTLSYQWYKLINPLPTGYPLTLASQDITDEQIFSVQFGNMNNTQVENCGSNYTDYSTIIQAPTVAPGATVPFSVFTNECDGAPYYSSGMSIFIDYNRDGDFDDAGEKAYTTTALTPSPNTRSGNIIIPSNASIGLTKMRVIVEENATSPNSQPTAFLYFYGEVEDYAINIASSATSGYALAASAPYSTVTTNALTLTNPKDTITGNFYVIVKTAAGCSAVSAVKTLTVKPLPKVSISSSANVGQLCTLSSSLPTTLTANLVSTFNATPTYLWTQSNVSLAITTSTYNRTTAWVSGAYYMCRVTTAVGDSATCAVPAIAQCDTIRPLLENTTTNTWTTKSPLSNFGRNGSVGFSIGNRGYIATGNTTLNGVSVNTNELWEYNPFLNSWTQKANYPGGKIRAGVGFSIGNKGYVGTGINSETNAVSNAFYEYDPIMNTWSQKANCLYSPYFAVGFSVGNKGYIGTGVVSGINSRLFYEYDPVTDQWTSKTDYPAVVGGLNCAVAFSIGSKAYVGTGNNGNDINAFYEFNPLATGLSQWVIKPAFPGIARHSAVGFSIGNKGYIGTGISSTGTLSDFYEYDTLTSLWSAIAQATYASRIAAAFAIGNKGYLATGTDITNTNVNNLLEYNPSQYSIKTGAINNTYSGATSFCSGSTITVPFTLGCTSTAFTTGNVFKVQLSDEYGNFSNPIEIGSVTGTTAGTITATIPKNLTNNGNYRVRVVSTSPQVIGYMSDKFFITTSPDPGRIGTSHSVPYPWELTTDSIRSISEASPSGTAYGTLSYSWERTFKYNQDALGNYTIPDTAITSTTLLPFTNISTPSFTLTNPSSIISDSFYRRKATYAGCGVSVYSNVVAIKVFSKSNTAINGGNGRKNGKLTGRVVVATSVSTGVSGVTITFERTTPILGGVLNKTFTTTTNSDGYYSIDTLFYGDQLNGDPSADFKITPSLTISGTVHQFQILSSSQPPPITVPLSTSSPSPATSFDFKDLSTYSITGAVKQTCSVCTPVVTDSVSNVNITLTSTALTIPKTTTTGTGASGGQPYGQYSVDVTIPTTYTITPSYKGHQYSQSSMQVSVNQNLSQKDFTDTSTRVISGFFCASNEVQDPSTGKIRKQYIGTGKLRFTDYVDGRNTVKFIKEVDITYLSGDSATFSVRLPARKYKVSFISFISSTAGADITQTELLSFFNSNLLANTIIDIDSTNAKLDLYYHRKPTITFDDLNEVCPNASGYVLFEDGKARTFTARIWEGPSSFSLPAGGSTVGFPVATDYLDPCSSNPVGFTVAVISPSTNATNGSITARVNGGSPSNYSYSKDGVNYVRDSLFNNLGAGNYIIYVKNATGCVASQVVALSTICSQSPVTINATVVNPTPGRNDGQIIITAPDKNLYQFSTNYGATFALAGTDTIKNLGLGSYTLIAKSTTTAACLGVKQVALVSTNPRLLKVSSAIQSTTTAPFDYYYILSGGNAKISIVGGSPNIIRPFLKSLSFNYTDRYNRSVDSFKRAVVVGDYRTSSSNFFTVNPTVPLLVLHQPPGNLSKSYWSENKSTSTAIGIQVATDKSRSIYGEVKLGFSMEFDVIGGSIGTSIWATAGLGFNTSAIKDSTGETMFTTQTLTSYETNSIGGDLFVGAGINMSFFPTVKLKYLSACVLDTIKSVEIVPNGFSSKYVYTELYIKNSLIPQLLSVSRDMSLPKYTRDTALVSANTWQQILDNNNDNKQQASVVQANRSFSSGQGPQTDELTTSKSTTNTIITSVQNNSIVTAGCGFDVFGSGISFEGSLELKITTGTTNSTNNVTQTTSGFRFEDNSPLDAWSVDIKKDPAYGTFVFQTITGQSSCPAEPNTIPINAAQLDVPDLYLGSPNRVQNNIPTTSSPRFHLILGNTSQVRTNPNTNSYILKVNNNSLADAGGPTVTFSGANVAGSNGFLFTNLTRLNSLVIPIDIMKSANSQIYSVRVKFEIWDDCLTEILDTAWITANFVNPCATNISLTSPNNNFVVNSASNNILPISFTGYNTSSFSSVTIQYAKAGTSSWIDDIALYPNQTIIAGSTSTTYNWNVFGLNDSVYDVRLKLICNQGAVVYSNIVSGIIDRKAPSSLGNPKPSDGNYINGDEISFSYNENIDNSNLNTNTISMFKVVGTTNTPIAVSVSGYQNKIVIVPIGTLVPGDIIRVVATNVRDIYGNTSTIKDTLNFIVGTSAAGTSRTITIANTLLNGSPKRAILESVGDSMRVVFTMGNIPTGNTINTTVGFAVGGTAVYGTDYTVSNASSFNNSQGTILIPSGSSSAILNIKPIADGVVEPDESIIITLLSGADYTLGTGITLYDTIKNDNLAAPVITPTGTACNRILTTASTIGGQAVTAYQWKLVGSTAILSTTATYTPTVSGSYTVTVYVGTQLGTSAAYVYTRPTATTSTTNTTVCNSSLPYVWNGQSLTAAGTYTATLVNAAGCDSVATLVLTVSTTVPAAPSTITQLLLDNTCGARVYRYTATAVTGATAYSWILPTSVGGVSGVIVDSGDVNTSRIIRLKYASNLAAIIGDTIRVNAIQGSCPGAFKAIKLTNAALSVPTPTAINGITTACIGTSVTFTVTAGTVVTTSQTAASVYRWTIPANTVISSASLDSSSIVLRFNTGYTGGSITCKGQIACGIQSAAKTLSMQYQTPTPTAIASSTGLYNACIGTPITFTATVAAPTATQVAASVYRWTIPANTVITSATPVGTGLGDSLSVTVQFNTGYTGGNITVKGQTACYSGTAKSQALTHTGCPVGTTPPLLTKLGVENVKFDASIQPNPTTSSFNLQVTSSIISNSVKAKIMDVQGRLIKTLTFASDEKINFGNELNPGVYMVEVREGEKVKTVRVVKY